MKISQTSVLVDDQDKALQFYTDVLEFVKKGDLRPMSLPWLTVVSPEGPDDLELVIESSSNPATKTYQKAMFEKGTPAATFLVADIQKEYERLKGQGVKFQGAPAKMGPKIAAVLDDTCGNLIKIFQPNYVRMTRRFAASAERVFDAWTDPEKARKWLFTSPTSEKNVTQIDARVGGKWSITDRREGTEYTGIGEYLEIDRPRRLVFTFGMPEFSASFTRVVVQIVVDGKGCIMTLTQEGVHADNEEQIEEGWSKMFDVLAATQEG
jgi:uncharacterized protein YndB with AHSA1/START domain/catechol 2,3-dioxygenase-like lactoylglutathione lyase family enzyme